MNKKDMERIVRDCRAAGHDIRVRDICYCLLKADITDSDVIYNSLFEKTDATKQIMAYEKSKAIRFLSKYLAVNYGRGKKNVKVSSSKNSAQFAKDISFEENKAELVKMIDEIDNAVKNQTLEYKDALKMKVDIRTKLNDKFKVTENSNQEKIVVVPPKMNGICKRYNVECFFQTKEYAMKTWNLIEKPQTADNSNTDKVQNNILRQ